MNLGERIKKLRKELTLTQQEFASRIGIKRNTVANYEINRNIPVDAVLTLICREFNVNETWLRDGVGEVFLAQDGSIISQMTEQYHLDEKTRALVESFLTLPEYERNIVVAAFERAAEAVMTAAPALPKSSEATGNAAERQQTTHTVEMTEEEYREFMRDRTEKECGMATAG